MGTSDMPPPCLLVVEPTEDLRETLMLALTEEGYLPRVVASFEAAHRALDEQTFEFVLADLFVGSPQPGLTQARWLQRRARPTPVGLLTAQNLPPEQAKPRGFAFLLRMPFDLEELLGLIAAHMHRSFTEEQARQVEVVEQFFLRINRREMDAAMQVCAEQVVYYPVPASPIEGVRKVEGRAALRAYLEELFRRLPGLRFEEVLTYGRPKGLAARYTTRWSGPDGSPQQLTGTTLFHFRGEQITEIGVWMNSERLNELLKRRSGG